jgi:2-polyprenyl-6-methoxyphenol hydroxylase-like FAD-dependent oxidoreductase
MRHARACSVRKGSVVLHVQVHVYERARELRPSGGIGLFSGNVFAALEAIGSHVAKAVQVRPHLQFLLRT